MKDLLPQLTLACLLAAQATSLVAQDKPSWPQLRGPNRDGISHETGWSLDGRAESLWTKNLGIGNSCISVVGDRVFSVGHVDETQTDTIFCLNSMTGEEVWTHSFSSKTWKKYHTGGSNATPSVAGGRVFVSHRDGIALCLDANNGKVLWEKNLKADHKLTTPYFGFGASPLILGEKVIMNMGKVFAFDRDGGLLWKSKYYGHSYATPIDAKIGGKDMLLVFNGNGLVLLDPTDGAEIAAHEWITENFVNAATPVVIGDRIFISSGYNRGGTLLKYADGKLEALWENRVMRTHQSGAVHHQDYLYGFDEGTLKCLDLKGKEVWRKRGLGKGALILVDGKLVMISLRGVLVIAKANPKRYQELSRAEVLSGAECRTTPVLCGGLIFCRNSAGDVVCRDHRAAK